MKWMRTLVLSLVLGASLALAGCGDDTAACGQADQQACSTTHTTCVSGCNPLDPAYDACVTACDDDLCSCLTAHGCTCN